MLIIVHGHHNHALQVSFKVNNGNSNLYKYNTFLRLPDAKIEG